MDSTIIISDDECSPINTKRKSPTKDDGTVTFVPDGDYGDEIIFVEPEDYSPKKKLREEEEKRKIEELEKVEHIDSEVAVTFNRKGIDFPHAREHCRNHPFTKITSNSQEAEKENCSNEQYCEKCYCFVCDELASKVFSCYKYRDKLVHRVVEKKVLTFRTLILHWSNIYLHVNHPIVILILCLSCCIASDFFMTHTFTIYLFCEN